jgi:hypothetical protein
MGMKQKNISLKLLRVNRTVEISCLIEDNTCFICLDWDTINLHIEKHESDVFTPRTPEPSEHKSS